jgi:hypothetical protein
VHLFFKLATSSGARVAYVLLAGALIYYSWMAYEIPYRIGPGLLAAAQKEGRVNILVRLGFPPERFHILKLQDIGRVRSVTGTTVHMAAVDENGIRTLAAKYYWVKHIDADNRATK